VIEQVRLNETVVIGSTTATNRVFGFGTFPGADPGIEHHVSSGAAAKNSLRIIFGKLLVGNYLEQIQCRTQVRMDVDGMPTAFDNVPLGATPDDIAKCCVTSDVLNETCTGPLSSCICQLQGGCKLNGNVIDQGKPVGILDENNDGAADFHRFTPRAVSFKCTQGGNTVTVQPNLDASYWNPSGFQQAPYTCKTPPCYDQVGPAIILIPQNAPDPVSGVPLLPTNMDCGLEFSPDVVDHSNLAVCAAPMGRPADCQDINLDKCTLDQLCTPGDVSAFNFHTEPLTVSLSAISDGDVGIDRTQDVLAQANVPVDPGSIANMSITENGAAFNGYTVTLAAPSQVKIHPTAVGGFAANAMYAFTFQTTWADYFHQGLPATVTIHFTTGP
jgi:hypothetical protein